jgi:hypothetical protein
VKQERERVEEAQGVVVALGYALAQAVRERDENVALSRLNASKAAVKQRQ